MFLCNYGPSDIHDLWQWSRSAAKCLLFGTISKLKLQTEQQYGCSGCSASILYASSSDVPDRRSFHTTNMIKLLKRNHLKEYIMLTLVTQENTSPKQQTGIFSTGKRNVLETATRQEKLQREVSWIYLLLWMSSQICHSRNCRFLSPSGVFGAIVHQRYILHLWHCYTNALH